jgi:hypothetical protein
MNDASKALLTNAVKEWNKFAAERDKMKAVASEVASLAQRVVLESVSFLKMQNIDVQADDPNALKIMGHPVIIEPLVEANFPTVKTRVNMTCSGATRSIVINPNLSISAGGNPFMFDQFKKGIPESFTTNAAEFVSDAFLFIARNLGQEQKAAEPPKAEQKPVAQQSAQVHQTPPMQPRPQQPQPPPRAPQPQPVRPAQPQMPPKPPQKPG